MKYLLTISVIILLLGYNVKAQFLQDSLYSKEDFPKKNILKTNPFAIFQGSIPGAAEYRLGLEHVMGDKYSIQISGSYLGKGCAYTLIEAMDTTPIQYIVKGFRVQAEIRYYLNNAFSKRKAPKGFYFAPTYSYSHAKITDRFYNSKNAYISYTFTYYGGKLGFQMVSNNLAFDIFIGAGYRDNIVVDYLTSKPQQVDEKDYSIYTGHLKILFGLNFGYAFD